MLSLSLALRMMRPPSPIIIMNILSLTHTSPLLLSHLPTEPGPAAGEGVGVLEEPAGEVAGTTSAVAVKSSLQIGEEELNSSTSNRLRNLRSWMESG